MGDSLGAEDLKSSKSVAAVSDRRSIFLKAEQSDGQGGPLQNRFDDEPYLRLNPMCERRISILAAITCFRARKADSSDEANPAAGNKYSMLVGCDYAFPSRSGAGRPSTFCLIHGRHGSADTELILLGAN